MFPSSLLVGTTVPRQIITYYKLITTKNKSGRTRISGEEVGDMNSVILEKKFEFEHPDILD